MRRVRKLVRGVAPIFLLTVAACTAGQSARSADDEHLVLRVGSGPLPTSSSQSGIREAANRVVLEGLVNPGRDGRPVAGVFDRWSVSDDHLVWLFHLRQGTTFHDGTKLTAQAVEEILTSQLPGLLGPAFQDIDKITATSESELRVSLRQPSAFLLESLNLFVRKPGAQLVGTGPFKLDSTGANDGSLLLTVNDDYDPPPAIHQVLLKPYPSTRAAWADLLRGELDMLYEVPLDALDSLEPSTRVTVRRMRHSYQYMLILNVRRPELRSAQFRRGLNSAVDRKSLIMSGLDGHGTEADGPVWPEHWAYEPVSSVYDPQRLDNRRPAISLDCIFGADPARERLALALQKQLDLVGVHLVLEALPQNDVLTRLTSGNFDTVLSDFSQGPDLFRPYYFWHSAAPGNFGGYKSLPVDNALDTIRHATSDDEYKQGVVEFQRAIAANPPAIFIAWGEKIRAVSNRFIIPDTGDPWGPNLRLWKPADQAAALTSN